MTPQQQQSWYLCAARYATTSKLRKHYRRCAKCVRNGSITLFAGKAK